jgi:hypothetical protein
LLVISTTLVESPFCPSLTVKVTLVSNWNASLATPPFLLAPFEPISWLTMKLSLPGRIDWLIFL